MNKCDVIDRLEDEYGIKKDSLTKRELAIIAVCTNQLSDNDETELNLHPVSDCGCEVVMYMGRNIEKCVKCGKTEKV